MTSTTVRILPLWKSTPPPNDEALLEPLLTGNIEIPKLKRASKPKVRSGCVTCKIRRVKCDETKPECKRCTSTGRKCDGYAIKPRKKRSPSKKHQKRVALDTEKLIISEGLSLLPDVNSAELRSLQFYHYKTAPGLASYFDEDFWRGLVLQISQSEPAVLHAMAALGSLHEARERNMRIVPDAPARITVMKDESSTLLQPPRNEDEEFALVQYGKAITSLSGRLGSGSSVELALMACVLFVCVEFLRGDAQQALSHFRSGMNIALSSFAASGATTEADALERIKQRILPFLNRIELLSVLKGTDATWDYPTELSEAVPEEFNNIKEARDSFIHVANISVRFIRSMKAIKYDRMILPDHLTRQAALLRQCDNWSEALDRMLLTSDLTAQEIDAAKILRMHSLIAAMWLRRCMTAEETKADEDMGKFEIAIRLAESIQSLDPEVESVRESHSSKFLFDMEIVSPLYYIASSCRHPKIRRRAITLLKRVQRREGTWDSNVVAVASERIMLYEEKNLTTLDGSELPAEVDRIHGSLIESEPGINPKKHVATLLALPDGLGTPFKMWKEQIIFA